MAIKRIKAKDYPMIASWYQNRKLGAPPWGDLSETGWIADDRAAGWLLLTNSSVAIIEHLITNPNTVPSLRRKSVMNLTGFLVDTAMMMGFTNIVCASKHPSVHKVAKRLGFEETDLKFYHLNDDSQQENNYGSYLVNNADKFDDEK